MIEWRRRRHKGAGGPQYVLDDLAWWRNPQRQGPGATRTPAARTRQGMPEVRPERCSEANGGCQSFTRKGTNAYYSVVTCLECGHGERTKITEVATHTFETCPHDDVDRRGSTKTMCMIYCKQCCSYIDTRGRAEVERVEKTNSPRWIATQGAMGSLAAQHPW